MVLGIHYIEAIFNYTCYSMSERHPDKKHLIRSAWFPLFFTLVLWLIKVIEMGYGFNFAVHGLYPLEPSGLQGILFAPFIHGSWKHLFNNTFPLLFLLWTLKYFYREIFWKVFLLIFFIHSFWLWFFGRDAFHIGASGIIYGLGAFLFVSGLIRRNSSLLSISMVVAFLYGSMVWGIFPLVEEVSWEAHLTGMLAGIFLAFYYRDFGPPPNIRRWKYSEYDEAMEEADGDYWERIQELEDEDRKPPTHPRG